METCPPTCQMTLCHSPVCSMKQESLPIMDSKEEGKGGRSRKLSSNCFWKCLTLTEKLKTNGGLRGDICSWPTDPFFKRSMHYRKKHASQSQHFPLHPLSQLLLSEEASSEPIILSRAELYCTWHILEWSHCGLLSVFSFHPTKRKSSGPRQPSTIPVISWGTAAGRGGRAAC